MEFVSCGQYVNAFGENEKTIKTENQFLAEGV